MSTLRPAEPGGKRITGVGVLDRSVGLLDLLADGPRTLRWLADASGLPRPTAYRLLVALEAHRLVARDATGAFELGPRLAELAVRAGPALDLAAVAGPALARLHDATGESVQLYVRSGDRRLCVAARDAGTGLRDSVPVGALLPLDAGSGGKVLLAWSQPRDAQPARRRAAPRARRTKSRGGRAKGAGPIAVRIVRRFRGAICTANGITPPGRRFGPFPAPQRLMTTFPRARPACRYRTAAGVSLSG
jgi:DNA-binding transcriptional ArsR family regulator